MSLSLPRWIISEIIDDYCQRSRKQLSIHIFNIDAFIYDIFVCHESVDSFLKRMDASIVNLNLWVYRWKCSYWKNGKYKTC